MQFRYIENISEEKYEEANEKSGCLLQSIGWAKVKNNWDSKRVGLIDEDDNLVAWAQILIKRLPLGYSMYYIPRGPISNQKQSTELIATLLTNIQKNCKKDRCVFIKYDPYIIDNEFDIKEGRPETHNTVDVNILSTGIDAIHKGYTLRIEDTVQPRTTMGVYLKGDYTKRYARDMRRKLKKANKANMTATISTKEDIEENPAIIDEFCGVMHKTEEAQGIQLRDKAYFKRMIDSLPNAFIAISRAEDGTCASGMMCIPYGKKLEMLYMGNDRKYINNGSGAFLYDEVFKYAKELGCDYGDMSGVEGTLDDGLTANKRAYGAVVKEYIGEFDLPVKKWMYKALMSLQRLRG